MKELFFEETKFKLKTINKLCILQITAAVLLSFWSLSYGVYGSYWQVNVFSVFFWSAIITGITYLIISIRKVVKIFSSQTWRLLPIKTHSLFAANIFSSLLSIFYYLVIEAGILFAAGLPLIQIHNAWKEIKTGIGEYLAEPLLWKNIRISDIILFFIFMACLFIFIYSFSILVNLTGNIIGEQFTTRMAKLISPIVKLSLLILATLVFINSIDSIMLWIQNIFTSGVLLKNSFLTHVDYYPLISSLLIIIVVDISLSVVNIFLLNNFSEAKA